MHCCPDSSSLAHFTTPVNRFDRSPIVRENAVFVTSAGGADVKYHVVRVPNLGSSYTGGQFSNSLYLVVLSPESLAGVYAQLCRFSGFATRAKNSRLLSR